MLSEIKTLFLVLMLGSCTDAALHTAMKDIEGVADPNYGSRLLGRSMQDLQFETDAPDCESKKILAQECFTAKCGSCVDTAFAIVLNTIHVKAIDCSVISNGMCPSITTNCDCEPCQQPIEDYFRCYFSSLTDGECLLDCSTTGTTVAIRTEQETSAATVRATFLFYIVAAGTIMMSFMLL